MGYERPLMGSKRRQKPAKPIVERTPWHERAWPAILLLIIVTLIAFEPVFSAEFVAWDDNINVVKNPLMNPPTLASVKYIWTHSVLQLYIPISYTSWVGLAAMAQRETPDVNGVFLNPLIFHATNVVLHALAAMTTFVLLRRLVKSIWPATIGALLFALHPLQVEPVAWVTGMKDLLFGLFCLAALWQYLCFIQIEPDAPVWKKATHYVAMLLLFVLASLSKPLGIAIPATACWYSTC